jgi:hypothetical protein
MEKLHELVRVFHPKRISYVSFFSHQLNSDSKLMQLYQGIQTNKITDDESGAALLYPNDEEGKSKFSKLKYHFRKRATNTILLIEVNDENGKKKRRKAFFDCLRTFVIAYFLIILQARSMSIHLLKNKLKVMQHYDFTFLIIESAKLLRQHHAAIVGNLKKAREYDDIISTYMPVYTFETRVEGYYYELMSYYVNNKSSKSFIYNLATSYVEKTQTPLPIQASSSLIFKVKMMEIIQAMSASDYLQVTVICEEAVELLKAKPFLDFTAISAIYFQWINCALHLKEFKKCEQLVKEVMEYMDEGDYNWYKGMLVLINVSFHEGKYQEGYAYYLRGMRQKGLRKLPAVLLEEWKVYEAYLHLLIVFGKVNDPSGLDKKAIKLHKFLNEVPISLRDKEGMNVPITIYSILVYMHKGQYNKVIRQSDALYKYAQRHLKGKNHKRTNYFIKMLVYLCKANCSYALVKDKIDELYEQLQQRNTTTDNNYQDMEIIPYEVLWNMLLEHLNSSNGTTQSTDHLENTFKDQAFL